LGKEYAVPGRVEGRGSTVPEGLRGGGRRYKKRFRERIQGTRKVKGGQRYKICCETLANVTWQIVSIT
jgi:hypothetical protein